MLPAVLVTALALAAAVTWPPTYRWSVTVVIEEAEIPDGLVDVGFQGYVEGRLEAITRRITVTDNLIDIIEHFDLFAEKRRTSRMPGRVPPARVSTSPGVRESTIVALSSDAAPRQDTTVT